MILTEPVDFSRETYSELLLMEGHVFVVLFRWVRSFSCEVSAHDVHRLVDPD